MGLTPEQVLAAEDFKATEVDVPEWGGTVLVRVMSGRNLDRYNELTEKSPEQCYRARLVAFTACNERGELLFTEEHIAILSAKNWHALQRVFEKALEINILSKKASEEAKGE